MLRVHEIIGKLSKTFQENSETSSEIQPVIEWTVERLTSIRSKDGDALKEMRHRFDLKTEEQTPTAYNT